MVSASRTSLRTACAFTLVELLVVMAIIATLLTLAVPRYLSSVDRSREAVLRENLRAMRSAIDQYHADNDRYPDSLDALATKRYLRAVPIDPITESASTWVTAPPPSGSDRGLVYDVRSGAPGASRDGSPFSQW